LGKFGSSIFKKPVRVAHMCISLTYEQHYIVLYYSRQMIEQTC
jgi:hypothetical protein